MRTIKTYSKRAPFYNAFIKTYTENGPSKEPLRQSDAGVGREMNHKMKEEPPNIPTVEPITSSRFC